MRLHANVFLPALGILLLAAWTYGHSLPWFFSDIDDATILHAAQSGVNATPQFRPVFEAWNRLVFGVFGPDPLAWRALGLALHCASAFLIAALVRLLGATRAAAWVAAAAFAAFYSGHEAVLWIAADCGLLSVFFALVAANAFAVHLQRGQAWALVVALAAAVLAMGSKQDCVLLGPLLVGIEVHLRGWRSLLAPRSLARYGLLAAFALVWLALAWRPELWSQGATVGRYELDSGSLLELLGHLGLLLAIGRVARSPDSLFAIAAGAAFVTLLIAFARASPRRRVPLVTGLCASVCAILPVLPGHVAVAATRYAYPAGVGIALIAAAVFDEAWERAASRAAARTLRGIVASGLVALLFAAWIGVETLAIRSIERWRFEPRSARFAALVDSTRALAGALAPGSRAAVVAPSVWNVPDYTNAVAVFARQELRVARTEWLGWPGELEAALEAGGTFDRRANTVLTCSGSGALVPLAAGTPLPAAAWKQRIETYAPGSPAGRAPVVVLERLR